MRVSSAEGSSVADSLRDARITFRSARYDTALEILEGCEDWPSQLAEAAIALKGEVLNRRDPLAAIEYLSRVQDIPSTPDGRFACALEFAKAHAAVRDFSAAESRYADARALAASVPHGPATMAYHDVRMRFLRRDCDPTAPECDLAVAHPDPNVACSAYSFRAWMHAYNGNFAAHISDLRRSVAYATMATGEPIDVYVLAASTYALAQASFETADDAGIAAARAASEAILWTPDVQSDQFATVRAFGLDHFMRGRAAHAQWTFNDARALAPSTVYRIVTHLDRAFVARVARNEFWAMEELAHADRLAHDVPWDATVGEERQVLVLLAVLHAPLDAVRAQRYAAMYSRIGTESANPRIAIYGYRPVLGHAKYAQGRIDQTLGRREAAERSLREAYEIFDEASWHYRAATAAAALAEVTGEERWATASVAHASRYPDSPLATLANDAVAREDAMPPSLSPLQRQIARALWAGAQSAELSRRFSRSIYTIERQIADVFEAFGVGSRSELFEAATARGLV